MTALWPSVAEERAMEVARRAEEWRKDGLIDQDAAAGIRTACTVPWKSNGLIVSVVFFALTSMALSLADALLLSSGLRGRQLPFVILALLAIGVAELLIHRAKLFGTGVESALWLGGLLVFVFSLPHSGKPEALLVIAAAFAIAGGRMRNPLMTTVALVLAVAYLGAKEWPSVAILAGVAIGVAALVACAFEWRRPSTAVLWDLLLLVMPLAGILAGAIAASKPLSIWWGVLFALLAAVSIGSGIARRIHAPLLTGFVSLCVVSGILDANGLLPWKPEVRAIVGGALLLGFSAISSRFLRSRTRGITATPTRLGEIEELTQLVAAIHVQHGPEPAAAARAGGGEFGGAGATGEY